VAIQATRRGERPNQVNTYPAYEILTTAAVPAYIASQPRLSRLVDAAMAGINVLEAAP
jgi:hypothetical protein